MTTAEKADLAVLAEIMRRVEAAQAKATEKNDELAAEVMAIKVLAHDTQRRVATIEPVTQMVTSWHARMVGASLVFGLVGTVLALGWALLRDKIGALWAVITG